MLKRIVIQESLIVIIDVQDKLVQMLPTEVIRQKVSVVAQAATILNIPIVVTEQYPQGLGHTIEIVKGKLDSETKIIEKTSFSAFEAIKNELKKHNKKQIIVCGIETHICVLQTVLDLIENGYEVAVIKDACGSRNPEESISAIERLKQNNAAIMTVEMALFELLGSSKHPGFKAIQSLIK